MDEEFFLSNIVSILLLGNKFVPNFYTSKTQFFNYLLYNLDLSILKFDDFLNISKANFSKEPFLTSNLLEVSLEEENLPDLNEIFKNINKKFKQQQKNNNQTTKKFLNVDVIL